MVVIYDVAKHYLLDHSVIDCLNNSIGLLGGASKPESIMLGFPVSVIIEFFSF